MNKDHENKNIIESKDQVRNNQSGKVENSTGTPEKSQQKDNEKSKDSGDKGGILPNTGEAIQNHPIVTTASILLLLTFGIALVFFRRKQQ
nr:LPXTG cell wall anchor domain-containing protein [Mammaliicoccus vitulinus]